MEPFEISLTFIQVQVKKNKHKKKTAENFSFHLHQGKRSLGIQNQTALSNVWVSLYWFLWDFFWYVLSVQDFEAFPKPFISKRWKVVVVVFVLSGIFPALPREILDWSLSLFFGMAELSSLSPPHWAQISSLWRHVNVTKHRAICSTVMHHRLAADITATLWLVHAHRCCCKYAPKEFFDSTYISEYRLIQM